MKRRFAALMSLGLGVLAGAAGCGPSTIASKQTTQSPPPPPPTQTTKSKKPPSEATAKAKNKELPKRNPQAMTCVRAGDFYLGESMVATRTQQDRQQQRETARRAYLQALQLDPNCLEAHLGLARVHEAGADHERAVSSYKEALRVAPREAVVWFELGMCHGRKKEWEAAVDAVIHAAELDPENRQYSQTVGFFLAKAGRFEEALGALTRVVGEPKARFYLARAMFQVGQDEQGRQQLQFALRADPEFADAKKWLAELDSTTKPDVVRVKHEEPQP